MTAFGTVGATLAAFTAVVVALRSDRKSEVRVRDEHDRGDSRVGEERRLALEREQRVEAYRVQVVLAQTRVGGAPDREGDPDGSLRRLAAMVANHGNYTITSVAAHFVFSERVGPVEPQRSEYLSGFADLPRDLRGDWGASPAYAMQMS